MKVKMAAVSLLGSVVMATTGVGFAAAAQPGGPGGGQLSQQDQTFMIQNAQTDLAEITVGQLAAQRATTAPIRQAAQTIATDHQQVLSKLQDLARNLHVTLPNSPDATQQQLAQQLNATSGTGFDQAYLQAMVQGHQTSINQTQQEIQSGSNPQVIDFAKSYLPGAQKHLQMVQQLSANPSASTSPSPNATNPPSNAGTPGGANPPSGVNAGSGGQAATSQMPPELIAALAGGGALLVSISGAALLARRRPQ
jgi:putative membrane protein